MYFGLFPDVETAALIDQVRRQVFDQLNWDGKPLKPERLHVSLHHVGDYARLRTKYVYSARLAGAAILMRPFELTFSLIKSLDDDSRSRDPSRKLPLVLLAEADALRELHQMLGTAMRKNGFKAAEHLLTPHMTLSYGRRAIPAHAIEPIRFAVNGFVLIHSERGLTRYHVLDRWLLRREGEVGRA